MFDHRIIIVKHQKIPPLLPTTFSDLQNFSVLLTFLINLSRILTQSNFYSAPPQFWKEGNTDKITLRKKLSASMSSYQYLQTKGMNTEVFPPNTPRYQRLAKPKTRIDQNSNSNAFKVKRGALNYQITESLNKLAQPKRQPGVNLLNVPSSPSKTEPPSTVKQGYYKLINSSEQSKDAQESQKKKFLLDTYARITATRNRNCSKRLNELSKPKRCPMPRTETYGNFDNYFQTIKKYDPQSRSSLATQRKN